MLWVLPWWPRVPTAVDGAPISLSKVGLAALAVAREEIGKGEYGANNSGPDIDRYRQGGPGGAWCAAFVSYCLERGARSVGVTPRARSHNAKRLFDLLRTKWRGVVVDGPAPGDVVLFHRGAAGAPTGHVGIVSRTDRTAFWSLEGNRGRAPSKVREYQHEIGEALLLGFCRLP